mmetsp:Transcript_27641/g.38080  ORF Transcript_27641/g.38080 Transcript_27641/m.38080 type:complete len:231 (-) Transcript_27641:1381-2073(-)
MRRTYAKGEARQWKGSGIIRWSGTDEDFLIQAVDEGFLQQTRHDPGLMHELRDGVVARALSLQRLEQRHYQGRAGPENPHGGPSGLPQLRHGVLHMQQGPGHQLLAVHRDGGRPDLEDQQTQQRVGPGEEAQGQLPQGPQKLLLVHAGGGCGACRGVAGALAPHCEGPGPGACAVRAVGPEGGPEDGGQHPEGQAVLGGGRQAGLPGEAHEPAQGQLAPPDRPEPAEQPG